MPPELRPNWKDQGGPTENGPSMFNRGWRAETGGFRSNPPCPSGHGFVRVEQDRGPQLEEEACHRLQLQFRRDGEWREAIRQGHAEPRL